MTQAAASWRRPCLVLFYGKDDAISRCSEHLLWGLGNIHTKIQMKIHGSIFAVLPYFIYTDTALLNSIPILELVMIGSYHMGVHTFYLKLLPMILKIQNRQ